MLRRAAEAGWPILQQTAAAAVAWVIAIAVVDHESPFFAPIAAVVGLNATLGRRGSNAVRLLVGVGVGIVVGEIAVTVAGGGVWTLTAATFVAMVIAQLVDGTRIVTAQAAVSAIHLPKRVIEGGAVPIQTAPSPGPISSPVRIVPSVMLKMPGCDRSHAAFAAGQYWRAFASTARTPGMWAASPADWISDAPGQVRSCTHRNMPNVCAAAAISSD